jgi:fumarate reductase subunit C
VTSRYTPYHPKWYRPRTPIFWWLGRLGYTKFIARELTSLAVLYGAVLLLVQVCALADGAEAYARFEAWLDAPVVRAVHVVLFMAAVFHTVTWLRLAPKALVLHLGRRPIPAALVLAGHYAAWFASSALALWFLLRP